MLSSNAPLAQLDRASGYGPEGRGFESLGARQTILYFSRDDPGEKSTEQPGC